MLFTAPDLDPSDVAVIARIEQLKKQLHYVVGGDYPRNWTGLLRRNTFARNVRGSNAIEGFKVTMDDAVAAVLGELPIDSRDEDSWQANRHYREAMTYVLQKPHDPSFEFSVELLKSLHYMMLRYDLGKNPGRWRTGTIFVVDNATRQKVYEAPPIESVPSLVLELVSELNRASTTHSLVRAAMAHLNLVMIHPYADGNGRMARCLQTLVLCMEGILDPVFCSIEEYLGRPENTRVYYEVLAQVGAGQWNPARDARPWIHFCLKAHFQQAMTLLRRTRELQRISDDLEALVKTLRLPEDSVVALVDAALGHKLRNGTYRASTGTSEAVASRQLRALVQAGLLEAKGNNRGRFYLATPTVLAIRTKAAESKTLQDPYASA